MIDTLIRDQNQQMGSIRRYEVIRTITVDGHDVAWIKQSGPFQTVGNNNERAHHHWEHYATMCECDFTSKRSGNNTRCLYRQAAMQLRHLEIRREYETKFATHGLSLVNHIEALTLDLIEKGKAHEWLEDMGNGAQSYGGYFYVQTLATITDFFIGSLWEYLHPLETKNLIELDGAVVKEYTAPPPPTWDESFRITEDGWVGIASLPGNNRMQQSWKLVVVDPDGTEVCCSYDTRLERSPIFDPDTDDVETAISALREMIAISRRKRN